MTENEFKNNKLKKTNSKSTRKQEMKEFLLRNQWLKNGRKEYILELQCVKKIRNENDVGYLQIYNTNVKVKQILYNKIKEKFE